MSSFADMLSILLLTAAYNVLAQTSQRTEYK